MPYNEFKLTRTTPSQLRGVQESYYYDANDETLSKVLAAGYFTGFPCNDDCETIVTVNASDGWANVHPNGNGGASSYVYTKTEKQRVVWMGLDSLTAGASGKTYNIPFEKLARGYVGWGGRWLPFSPNENFAEDTDAFKTGNSQIKSVLPRSDIRRAMSLDGKGTFSDNVGARFTYSIQPDFNWTYADIYYLQQPSGGSVDVDYPTDAAGPTINTSGDYEVKKVTVMQRKKANKLNSQTLRLNNLSLDGPVCFYGVVFRVDSTGPIYINAGTGGQTTQEFVEYDATQQSDWFNKLGVTDAIMCAGMNDRGTRAAVEFESDLRQLCGRFDSSVKQYIVKPNEPDSGISIYDSVYPSVATDFGALLDLQDKFGTYAEVNAAGQMIDNTHPNEHYHYFQAEWYCKEIFGGSYYLENPPIIDYTAGDTQLQLEASYAALLARVEALENP